MANKIGFYRDGFYRKNVVTVDTGTSRYNVSPDESGTLFQLDLASTMNFILPRISSKALGLTYEFYISTQGSSLDVNLRVDVNDSSALLRSGFSSVVDRTSTARPATTMVTVCRVTAVSSIMWMLEQLSAAQGHTTDVTSWAGGWTTG